MRVEVYESGLSVTAFAVVNLLQKGKVSMEREVKVGNS